MNNVVPFRSKPSFDAELNISNFISHGRKLASYLGIGDFDSIQWDVTDLVKWKSRGQKRTRVSFVTEESISGNSMQAFPEPFGSVSKAWFLEMHTLRPTQVVHFRIGAIRAFESALREVTGASDVSKTNPHILNRAQQIIETNYAASTAYRVCGQLALLSEYLVGHSMTTVSFEWFPTLIRPSGPDKVGEEFDLARADKLPSPAALDALPMAYLKAREPSDVLITSVAAILVSSPDRIGEVLYLPENCEVWQNGPAGTTYGLRWWPAKGASPTIKYIVPSMREVVSDAIQKIRIVTEPARQIARWYENNPARIYLSQDCEFIRSKDWVSLNEAEMVLGLSRGGTKSWLYRYKISTMKNDQGRLMYRFSEIEDVLVGSLPSGFPVLDPSGGLKYSEALFVVRINELHRQRGTIAGTVRTLDTNFINTGFGSRTEFGFESIFSRLGLFEPDGSDISLTSHQFRHYLNTLAQAGGMSQLDIAKWSGRKDVRQNATYDHLSSDEILALVRSSIGSKADEYGHLAMLSSRIPIARDKFSSIVAPTAHITDIGYCLHDYSMSPCELHRDCINCAELVCIKGDEGRQASIYRQICDVKVLIDHARTAIDGGRSGADRWLDHHQASLEKLESLYSILSDPSIPDGSVIRLDEMKVDGFEIPVKGVSAIRGGL